MSGEARSVYPLGRTAVIGREKECAVVVTDPRVSRRHAEIERTEAGRYLLTALGSTGGTMVSGRRVMETLLGDRDEIVIGGVRLRFEDRDQRSFTVEDLTIDADTPQIGASQRFPVVEDQTFRAEREVADAVELRRD